jgi:1,4-dihydroxy-2-naphthoyl-CoA hydrolase
MTELENFADEINQRLGGWNSAMGFRFTLATTERVEGKFTVRGEHHQPYGIVHGGVHAGLIETACSTGAALVGMTRGQTVVGVDNHSTFLHAVREGTLTVTATPLSRGRRTQVWDGVVRDASGRVVATGRVRLICLEGGAQLAGEEVALKQS